MPQAKELDDFDVEDNRYMQSMDDENYGKPFGDEEEDTEEEGVEDTVDDEDEDSSDDDDDDDDDDSSLSDEPTEEELKGYSTKVKKRINQMTWRMREAERQKNEALQNQQQIVQFARNLVNENKQMKQRTANSNALLIQQAKAIAENGLSTAQANLRRAIDSGDVDAQITAQQALNDATYQLNRINSLKPPSLQTPRQGVQQDQRQQPSSATPSQQVPPQGQPRAQPQPQFDEKAAKWASENKWFGKDEEMTAVALASHNKLISEGVSTSSDAYYKAINKRMREIFPDKFEGAADKRRGGSRVAGASRGRSSSGVKLSASQRKIADQLGISYTDYAKQAKALEN